MNKSINKETNVKGETKMKTINLEEVFELNEETLAAVAKLETSLNEIPAETVEEGRSYLLTGIRKITMKLKPNEEGKMVVIYNIWFTQKDNPTDLFVRLFTQDVNNLVRVLNKIDKKARLTSGNGLLYLKDNTVPQGIPAYGYRKVDRLTGLPTQYVNIGFGEMPEKEVK